MTGGIDVKENDHPLAAYTFLFVVTATLGFAAKTGIESGRREALRQRIQEAAEIGDDGKLDQAAELLRSILRQHPSSAEAHFMLGVVLVSENQLDEADASFERALELEPTDWESLAERAVILKLKGQSTDALELLEKIPEGKGHLEERLSEALWADLVDNQRFKALLGRHGLMPIETTLRRTYGE